MRRVMGMMGLSLLAALFLGTLFVVVRGSWYEDKLEFRTPHRTTRLFAGGGGVVGVSYRDRNIDLPFFEHEVDRLRPDREPEEGLNPAALRFRGLGAWWYAGDVITQGFFMRGHVFRVPYWLPLALTALPLLLLGARACRRRRLRRGEQAFPVEVRGAVEGGEARE